MALLNRPLIGAAVVATLISPLATGGNPTEHKHHRDAVTVLHPDAHPTDRSNIAVETSSGRIDIAPHGTPLPEWARKIDLPRHDPKTDILAIARVYADDQGVIDAGKTSWNWNVNKSAYAFETEWPKSIENKYNSYGTHYVIRVPALGSVEASSGQGAVVLHLASDADVRTGQGSVKLHEVAGDIQITTGQGSVKIAFAENPGNIRDDRADVKTGQGSVTVAGAGWLSAKTGQGSITAELTKQPTDDISLKTGQGSISLDLPTGSNASVEARTAMGSVTVNGTSYKGRGYGNSSKDIEVQLGADGPAIVCKTNQGSITVN